jgi:hypothetical protein
MVFYGSVIASSLFVEGPGNACDSQRLWSKIIVLQTVPEYKAQ